MANRTRVPFSVWLKRRPTSDRRARDQPELEPPDKDEPPPFDVHARPTVPLTAMIDRPPVIERTSPTMPKTDQRRSSLKDCEPPPPTTAAGLKVLSFVDRRPRDALSLELLEAAMTGLAEAVGRQVVDRVLNEAVQAAGKADPALTSVGRRR